MMTRCKLPPTDCMAEVPLQFILNTLTRQTHPCVCVCVCAVPWTASQLQAFVVVYVMLVVS